MGIVAISLTPWCIHLKNFSGLRPNRLSFALRFRRHSGIFTSLAHGVEKGDINVRRMQWRSQYFGGAEPQRFQVLFPIIRTLHDNESIHLR